ncbi:MAG TPA: serine protease [Flavobacteriaceae bacterium]|jgi:serine protease Do|nr:serine protease [Flavobacteriaceae bacterium]
MKRFFSTLGISVITAVTSLAVYDHYQEKNQSNPAASTMPMNMVQTNFSSINSEVLDTDFTLAAENTVNAVVHVKNTSISRQPGNMMELFFGGGAPRAMIGTGSGVIISPDGYIISNNHVIERATDLEVTLNDNRIYNAEVIGTDPKTDIALLKIESDDPLPYIPFADSDAVKIGQWVLAVGNPFNLTSTVTAGIISAKARDLNEFDNNPQSFIQTDAAVNRGNSGGALVNTNGELVGINTAITSETGSYVGYSFAVPSNTARKVIEDLLEYGNVQRGFLGIQGSGLDAKRAQMLGIEDTQGVYVASVESDSGAEQAGLEQGDVIKNIDGISIYKFSDLTGYLNAKRPNDIVSLTLNRKGKEMVKNVVLRKIDTYTIADLGLTVKNTSKMQREKRSVDHGVIVTKVNNQELLSMGLDGAIITHVNDVAINTIDDLKNTVDNKFGGPMKLTFYDRHGEKSAILFR